LALEPGSECRECFRRGFSDYVKKAGLTGSDFDELISLIEENLRKGITPPVAGALSWSLLRRRSLTGADIFRHEKKDFTGKMLSVHAELRSGFMRTEEPAARALSAATWCNLLDVGQGKPLPEPRALVKMFMDPLLFDERHHFLERLNESATLLILGDNAGETVMDRLFLELSGFSGSIFYMVREKPVMNDAVARDAMEAGIHNVATIIPSGVDMPAVVPGMLSGKPLEVFRSADVILAKGQGNLEGLYGLGDPRIYHSFVVKCPVIARATGAAIGSGVFSRFSVEGGIADAHL
jgi:damage-control phosphatase, subfamily I